MIRNTRLSPDTMNALIFQLTSTIQDDKVKHGRLSPKRNLLPYVWINKGKHNQHNAPELERLLAFSDNTKSAMRRKVPSFTNEYAAESLSQVTISD